MIRWVAEKVLKDNPWGGTPKEELERAYQFHREENPDFLKKTAEVAAQQGLPRYTAACLKVGPELFPFYEGLRLLGDAYQNRGALEIKIGRRCRAPSGKRTIWERRGVRDAAVGYCLGRVAGVAETVSTFLQKLRR